MKHIILIIVFAFSSAIGFSQENALEETIKKQINYNDEDFFSFDVKRIPSEANLAVAIATKYDDVKNNKDYFEVNQLLYLYDSKSEKFIYKLEEKKKYISDDIDLKSVEIDSTFYDINTKEIAFGVKVTKYKPSRDFEYIGEKTFLYSINKRKIKIISEEIVTSEYKVNWGMNCNLEGYIINSILIMDSKMTNGFYNIKVKSTKTILKSTPPLNEDDDCIEENTTLAPVTQILTFKNGKYSLE